MSIDDKFIIKRKDENTALTTQKVIRLQDDNLLEGLSVIEMSLYDRMGKAYYQSSVNQELAHDIINYVMQTPSVKEKNIHLIKVLTKMAKKVYLADIEYPSGYLERVYDYHLQGIDNLERDYPFGEANTLEYALNEMKINPIIVKIYSHLQFHASRFPKKFGIIDSFDKTKEPLSISEQKEWAKKRFEHIEKAERFANKSAKEYSIILKEGFYALRNLYLFNQKKKQKKHWGETAIAWGEKIMQHASLISGTNNPLFDKNFEMIKTNLIDIKTYMYNHR
jgi:hypothetical protein